MAAVKSGRTYHARGEVNKALLAEVRGELAKDVEQARKRLRREAQRGEERATSDARIARLGTIIEDLSKEVLEIARR